MGTENLGWPTWIGIVADELDRQQRFYRDVLGFAVTAEGDGWVQFDLGPDRLLEIIQRGDEPEYDERRYQVGFAADDIEAAQRGLRDLGVEVVSELHGDPAAGGRWCYFRDPEGNVFELKERHHPAG